MKNKIDSAKQNMVLGVLIILLVITFFPFYIMIVCSFKYQLQIIENPWYLEGVIHIENYSKAFFQIYQPILNSIFITGCVIICVLFLASCAAYSFMRFDYPGKNLFYALIIMLLMIPGFVILVPQFILVTKLGWYNTFIAQILPPAASLVAMATMLTTTFFKKIPGSLLESAELEGANEFQIFGKIVIPLSKPIMATAAIITGLNSWNNYIWPLVCTSGADVRPITVALNLISSSLSEGDGVKLAGYVIASVPILVLFSFCSKQFVAGLTQGAVKS